MKPFEELSHLGRIRRVRRLAQAALNAYGLPNAEMQFLKQAGNTLFRVREAHPDPTDPDNLFAPGQYLLRIHQPGYQAPEAIESDTIYMICRWL
jgi:hypothetical protein